MKTVTLLQNNLKEKSTGSFFPRIIREFEDDDESMFWD